MGIAITASCYPSVVLGDYSGGVLCFLKINSMTCLRLTRSVSSFSAVNRFSQATLSGMTNMIFAIYTEQESGIKFT